jgi:mRNA-degrading endonuclease RelE of RelBE toxin-antitoxin system
LTANHAQTFYTNRDFWGQYEKLPAHVRQLADKNFSLLKENPNHPSLHLKRVGKKWSVRVGDHYRAVGVNVEDGILWFWIGSHTEYDKVI